MKILFFEIEKTENQEYIKEALADHDLYFFPEPLKEDSIVSEHPDAEIICISLLSIINKTTLNAFSQLKLIVTRSTGYDHIDIDCIIHRKITISNIPLYAAQTVAEHTFALILSLSRKIVESYRRIEYEHIFSCQNLAGLDLHEKTLGIVGMGNIGKNVAQIACGFGMNVIAHDIQRSTCEYAISVDLETLFATADIISLHVPLTKETHHLINKKSIKKIKKGAYLINTARGALIETEALLWALSQELIAGAACDVLENELDLQYPLNFLLQSNTNTERMKIFAMNQFLMNHPHTIITPHNAFQSKESLNRLLNDTITSIKKWLQQKK